MKLLELGLKGWLDGWKLFVGVNEELVGLKGWLVGRNSFGVNEGADELAGVNGLE